MIKNYDLTGWELFSDRRNSKNYLSADKTKMLKLSTDLSDIDVASLEREVSMTKKALELGINTPAVYDMVETADGKVGAIYDYIEGKVSLTRAISNDDSKVDYCMEVFARIMKDIHSKTCKEGDLPSMDEKIRKQVLKRDIFTEAQKEKAMKIMDNTEKKCCVLHSDMQPSNFIVANGKEYAIDVGGLSCGNPIYDLGFFYYFTHYMPGFIVRGIFKCSEDLATYMWYKFIKCYLGTNDKEEIIKFSDNIKKYSFLSMCMNLGDLEPGPELKYNASLFFDEVCKDI